ALEVFLAAGSPPASPPDLDPGMTPYLTWLETEDKRPAPPLAVPVALPPSAPSANLPPRPSGKPSSATVPTAAALAKVDKVKAEKTKEERPTEKADRRRARKERRSPPVPVAKAVPVEESAFNVELVPLSGAAPAKSKAPG